MTKFPCFFLVSAFLFSACGEPANDSISPFNTTSEMLSISEVKSTPEAFYPDTISQAYMTFRLTMSIKSIEKVRAIATLYLSDPTGYRSSASNEFTISPSVTFYQKSFSLPVDTSGIGTPTISLRLGTTLKRDEVIISPVVRTLDPVSGPPVIDSIRFNPANRIARGSVFTMMVWTSDPRGPGHIGKVTVVGKRPDGSNQTPFDIPKVLDGYFSLSSEVQQSSQTGIFEWKFIATNRNGITSQPVIRTYEVVP